MEQLPDRSAKGLFELVKRSLEELKISLDGLASQSYDGASVMSGEHGGLQALINEFCVRFIVYIHCFCHRLHSALAVILETIEEVKKYFSTVTALYTFF